MNRTYQEKREWYFAIGSMMNPMMFSNRGIHPVESMPAELLNHKIIFYSSFGFATAVCSKGNSFHGVLYKMEEKGMKVLDSMEPGYRRTKAKARLYNGVEVECIVYCHSNPKKSNCYKNDKPPTQRYMDIMVEGANHYGV